MSERWGYEDAAKLRERITAIETNLPLMRLDMERQFKQIGETQASNREWTEKQFTELTTLIKAVPIAPKPQNDRLFVLMLIIGAIVTVILVMLITYVIFNSTGGNLT